MTLTTKNLFYLVHSTDKLQYCCLFYFLGCTPLHWAARRGNVEACTVLVHAGTKQELLVKDNAGFTPIQLASDKGHRHIALFLVRNYYYFFPILSLVVYSCKHQDSVYELQKFVLCLAHDSILSQGLLAITR